MGDPRGNASRSVTIRYGISYGKIGDAGKELSTRIEDREPVPPSTRAAVLPLPAETGHLRHPHYVTAPHVPGLTLPPPR